MPDKPDRCQGKRLGLRKRKCTFLATETLGDKHAVGLCGSCMHLYWLITEHNPDEAERIRKKVGMRDG